MCECIYYALRDLIQVTWRSWWMLAFTTHKKNLNNSSDMNQLMASEKLHHQQRLFVRLSLSEAVSGCSFCYTTSMACVGWCLNIALKNATTSPSHIPTFMTYVYVCIGMFKHIYRENNSINTLYMTINTFGNCFIIFIVIYV